MRASIRSSMVTNSVAWIPRGNSARQMQTHGPIGWTDGSLPATFAGLLLLREMAWRTRLPVSLEFRLRPFGFWPQLSSFPGNLPWRLNLLILASHRPKYLWTCFHHFRRPWQDVGDKPSWLSATPPIQGEKGWLWNIYFAKTCLIVLVYFKWFTISEKNCGLTDMKR